MRTRYLLAAFIVLVIAASFPYEALLSESRLIDLVFGPTLGYAILTFLYALKERQRAFGKSVLAIITGVLLWAWCTCIRQGQVEWMDWVAFAFAVGSFLFFSYCMCEGLLRDENPD